MYVTLNEPQPWVTVRHVTTLGGTVPRGRGYVAGHGRAEAVEREVWGRAAAE